MTTIQLPKQQISGVMWKTVSEACNLACDYCYYSTCKGRPGKINKIDLTMLEKFIKEYMEIKKGGVPFVWQGGEPMLAGLAFFQEVIRLQKKHAPRRTVISNSIQTNGTMINEKWASFFKEYNFLVGVSIDGPKYINDARRVTSTGKGSYDAIMKGINHLKKAQVDFNILTVLHENNINHPDELMQFYQDNQFTHVQFIPCMDFKAQDINQPPQYHITPKEYGDFLCRVFDIWYNDGNPTISVRFFDNMLANYLNQSAELCSHLEVCPKTIIFEQNGDAYPCDFHIHDDYKLGNIDTDSLIDMLNHPNMEKFSSLKPAIAEKCKSCEFLSLCNGGCPRNRPANNEDTEYFCESFQQIYRHAHTRMEQLAINWRKQQINRLKQSNYPLPSRNEPCVCGSQKKFKHCCLPLID